MQAIRRAYQYDVVHNATSTAFILKELVEADGVCNLHDAPDVNALSQRGAANAVAELVSYMQKLMHSNESVYSATSNSDSSKESRQHRWDNPAARKKNEKATKSKVHDKPPINEGYKHSNDTIAAPLTPIIR